MVKNHRGRGQVSIAYLALLAAAVLIVVVLVVRQVWRSTTTEVWVTRDGIRAGEVIDSSKLVLASVSKTAVPPNAILDPSSIVGKTLQKNVEKGAPITVPDVTERPPFQYISDAPPEGKVVMTVRANLALPSAQLRYGDRLDMLAGGQNGPRVVGRDLILLGQTVLAGGSSRASGSLAGLVGQQLRTRSSGGGTVFVFAVDPNDVVGIAEAVSQGSPLTYVVHGRQEITSGRRVEIASHESSGQVELITGASRQRVH